MGKDRHRLDNGGESDRQGKSLPARKSSARSARGGCVQAPNWLERHFDHLAIADVPVGGLVKIENRYSSQMTPI